MILALPFLTPLFHIHSGPHKHQGMLELNPVWPASKPSPHTHFAQPDMLIGLTLALTSRTLPGSFPAPGLAHAGCCLSQPGMAHLQSQLSLVDAAG